MCPICYTKLTPIIYGSVIDDVLLGMHKSGQIILAGPVERYADAPHSYCRRCQEPSDKTVPIDNIIE